MKQDREQKPLRQRVEVPIPEDWPYEMRDRRPDVEWRADFRAGRMYLTEKAVVWAVFLAILLIYFLS